MIREVAFWVHILLLNFWAAVWWIKPGFVPAFFGIVALLLATIFGLAHKMSQPAVQSTPKS